MNLTDALQHEREAGTRKGPGCSLCRLITELPEEDSAALVTALAEETFTHAGISRALRESGHPIGGMTVGRHRNGECRGA